MNAIKGCEAIAIGYDPSCDDSPFISVREHSQNAHKIIQIARENDIPVVESPSLVRALSRLSVDERIPAHLFEAVAILFAKIEKLKINHR